MSTAHCMTLRESYAWAIAEAKAAMPTADVMVQEFDFGRTISIGVFCGPLKKALRLEGVDRDGDGRLLQEFKLSAEEIRAWIAGCALAARGGKP